jgi:hypothetical protein
MAIMEYGIGGNEIKVDASEAIAAIPENRTLIVEQLTSEESINPEVVSGLTNIDQVFAHYKPQIDAEFENAEGQPVKENFQFKNVGDFSVKSLTGQSSFLSGLNNETEFWEAVKKQLRSNKLLQRALEDPEAKQAFISSLQGILEELKEAEQK